MNKIKEYVMKAFVLAITLLILNLILEALSYFGLGIVSSVVSRPLATLGILKPKEPSA